MILFNSIFGNAKEFAELFGTPKNRKNKIFLAVLKSPMFMESNKSHFWDAETIYTVVMTVLSAHSEGKYSMNLLGERFNSDKMFFDEHQGLCNDLDFRAIRYCKNAETQNGTEVKVYKMKAGRLLRKIGEATSVNGVDAIDYFSEPVFNYVCEEFQRRWEKSALAQVNGNFVLKTGDTESDFRRIYDRYEYYGESSMNSCMQNKEQHEFYTESVTAKAAWLEDEHGAILARCVIFTEVEDCDNGDVLRLAERQYAVESGISTGNGPVTQDNLKRILVERLIAEDEIDGYKAVGAGCHEASAFVSKDGTSWSCRSFKIKCSLDPHHDVLSYQDSFKYYDEVKGVAYNDCDTHHHWELDRTERTLTEELIYDEYNDEYVDSDDVNTAMYNGREIYIANTRDFNWSAIYDFYIHEDECVWCSNVSTYVFKSDAYQCPECGEWYYPDGREYYSDITSDEYCCARCMEKAEDDYKREHWYHSPYDGEYYETRNDSNDEAIREDWLKFLRENLQRVSAN